MPANNTTAGRSASEIDQELPRTFFVRRGHIVKAFGLTQEEMTTLVAAGVFVAEYLPTNKRVREGREAAKKSRAVFVRSQVLAKAASWEGAV